MGLSFGSGPVCGDCQKEWVEWLGPEVERMEATLQQEQESFDANALHLNPEDRHSIAATLNEKKSTCEKNRAILNDVNALVAWQSKATEEEDLDPTETLIFHAGQDNAAQEAFLVQIFGTEVLRSSSARETALRDFEALRLIRDILDPGWRTQYADLGTLGTPPELEYWEARNALWREQRIYDILDSGCTDEFFLAEDLEMAVASDIDEMMQEVARRANDMLRMRRQARQFEWRRQRKLMAPGVRL